MSRASQKRSDGFEAEEGPIKRRRLQYDTEEEGMNSKDSNARADGSSVDDSLCDPRKPSNFIDFHFSILQSLYKKPQEESIAFTSAASLTDTTPASDHGDLDTEEDNEDTPIQESIWSMIECFLHERVEILRAKQVASCWSGIHKEARLIATSKVSSSTVTPGAFDQQSVSTSPSHHATRSPSFTAHYPSLSTSKIASTSPSSKQHPTAASFQIVARLVGKHSQTVSDKLEQHVHTYRSLSAFINERIAVLQRQLKRLEQKVDDEEQKRMCDMSLGAKHETSPQERWDVIGDKERSCVLALKTKIRLWCLLAADLSGIF